MKLIIAGTRSIDWDEAYGRIVESCRIEKSPFFTQLITATEIVSGTCRGVDEAGEDYADSYDIPVKRFPADWKSHGKVAGPIRNRQMAEYADALLLIWDGKSNGSKNMKEEMEKLSKPVYEIVVEDEVKNASN